MELKVGDRVRVKEIFNFDGKKLKKGLKGTVIKNNGDIYCIEFDTYINGHDNFGEGKYGCCWNFNIEKQKYFEIIKEKEMKKEDIILKRGDVVTYKLGGSFVINGYGDFHLEEIDHFRDIGKIERPIKYETIYEEPKEILDKEEKEYLEGVIRPFRDRVDNIEKISVFECMGEHISIELTNGEVTNLPYFKKNTIYKGMEANKEYTLKELGLFKGE